MQEPRALVALHVAVALFGGAALFAQWLAWPPVAIVLGRTAVAALTLAIVVMAMAKTVRLERGLLANGVILAVHWVTFFEAIQASSVAVGLVGYAAFPVFVLLLEAILLRRRVGATDIAISLVVVFGLWVIVPVFDPREATVRGLAWGLVSAFTFALLAVRNRRYAQAHEPIVLALGQNTFAALVLLPLVIIGRDALPSVTTRDLLLIAALGVVFTALAHSLFILSLRRVSAHTASVVAALEPVYGIALAAWLLNETPAVSTLIGAGILTAAAVFVTRRSR
ncbi:MAG TPA: DMT family transporter [Casimicrobiaceae bacterium]|nr:DMT family transporter [Casimicrobiaceae bacterium]